MNDKIPPRPWFAFARDGAHRIRGADGKLLGECVDAETAEFVVRLVNTEPEIVAALEAARDYAMNPAGEGLDIPDPIAWRTAIIMQIRAALAKVRP